MVLVIICEAFMHALGSFITDLNDTDQITVTAMLHVNTMLSTHIKF